MPSRNGAVHVATITRKSKGKSYVTHLLRRSYRQGGKVKHQTLGNLSHLPGHLVELVKRGLKGELPEGDWTIIRSLPHGNVAAVLGALRELGLENLIASRPSRERSLVVAMIVNRLIRPASKLATAQGLMSETATSSLVWELGLADVDEKELYGALDWLLGRQKRIENKLAKRHLDDKTLLLYDVTSSYYTGRRSKLIQFGYNRDGKRGLPQIVYGLLCDADGRPIAVEVFAGNTADPTTLGSQVQKVRQRFGVARVVIVGDRGMITSKRIDESLRDADGVDWITALRADSIKKLAGQQVIETSLFDQTDLAEVTSDDFPGERLIVCRNPLLADERRRKRDELLAETEKQLQQIAAATGRDKRALRGKDKIGLRVGKVINKYKMAKHFAIEITNDGLTFARDKAKIDREAALDGIYVIRTSVATDNLTSDDAVRAYKDLARVERAFRCMKTIDLHVRPIHHRLDGRICAHVFLCMLAYYVEWHLRQKLAPVLFDDHQRQEAEQSRASIVSPAPRSPAAKAKDANKVTDDGYPVQSLRSLLSDLATLAKNQVRIGGDASRDFYQLTQPTKLQQHVFDLLGLALPL